MPPQMQLSVLVTPTINPAQLAAMGAIAGKTFGAAANNATRLSQPLGRISGEVSEFEKSMAASNARVIAFGASAGGIFLIKGAFEKLISSTISVERSLADINVVLSLGQTELKNFSNEMFKAAAQTGQTFATASKVALEFARHGVSASETSKRMTSAMQLMRISGLSAGQAVNSITAAINSFSKEALSSEDIVNRLTAVDTKFAVSAQDLAKAIERVGTTAQDAGVRFNELLGLVTAAQTLTSRGGAVIGNAFKSIFTRLSRPQVLADLEAVGVTTKNASGQILPMISILKNLANQYDRLNYSQKSFITEAVGGVYQVNILKSNLIDMGHSFSIYDKATLTASNSTGMIQDRMAKLNETISSKLNNSALLLTKIFSSLGQVGFGAGTKGNLDFLNQQMESYSKAMDNVTPQDSHGEAIGKSFAEGIAKGVATIISGPGVQMASALLAKIMGGLVKFAIQSSKEFMGMNQKLREQQGLQSGIHSFLSSNVQLVKSHIDGQITLNELIQTFYTTLQGVNREHAQVDLISQQMAGSMGGRVSAAPIPHTPAAGFVPNFHSNIASIDAANAERFRAKKHGYEPGIPYQTIIHDGFGRATMTTVNSNETVKTRRNPQGHLATFVIPPNGFGSDTMYANRASGFVPNFAEEGVVALEEKEKKKIRKYKNPKISQVGMVRNIVKKLGEINTSDLSHFKDAYIDYHNLAQTFSGKLGISMDKFVNVFSALSRSNPVERNMLDALRLSLVGNKSLSAIGSPSGIGPPNVIQEMFETKVTTFNDGKSKAIDLFLEMGEMTGFKRKSFHENVLDPKNSDAVTVDFFAQSVAHGRQYDSKNAPPMSKDEYQRTAEAYRMAGSQFGMSGSEVQAATWVQSRKGSDNAIKQGLNRGILKYLHENPDKVSLENLNYFLEAKGRKGMPKFHKELSQMGISYINDDSLITIPRPNAAGGFVPNFARNIGSGSFGEVFPFRDDRVIKVFHPARSGDNHSLKKEVDAIVAVQNIQKRHGDLFNDLVDVPSMTSVGKASITKQRAFGQTMEDVLYDIVSSGSPFPDGQRGEVSHNMQAITDKFLRQTLGVFDNKGMYTGDILNNPGNTMINPKMRGFLEKLMRRPKRVVEKFNEQLRDPYTLKRVAKRLKEQGAKISIVDIGVWKRNRRYDPSRIIRPSSGKLAEQGLYAQIFPRGNSSIPEVQKITQQHSKERKSYELDRDEVVDHAFHTLYTGNSTVNSLIKFSRIHGVKPNALIRKNPEGMTVQDAYDREGDSEFGGKLGLATDFIGQAMSVLYHGGISVTEHDALKHAVINPAASKILSKIGASPNLDRLKEKISTTKGLKRVAAAISRQGGAITFPNTEAFNISELAMRAASGGFIPNFAAKELGHGYYGSVYKLKGGRVSKVFDAFGASHGAMRDEIENMDAVEEVMSTNRGDINPLWTFPKMLGKKPRAIIKEEFIGKTTEQLEQENTTGNTVIHELVSPFIDQISKVFDFRGIIPDDFEKNTGNTMANPELGNILLKIAQRPSQVGANFIRRLGRPDVLKNVGAALHRKGGRLAAVDVGSFHIDSSYSVPLHVRARRLAESLGMRRGGTPSLSGGFIPNFGQKEYRTVNEARHMEISLAQMSISPEVVYREMFQNAVAHGQSGEVKGIWDIRDTEYLSGRGKKRNEQRIYSITDMGKGMSPEHVFTKFLPYAETGEAEGNKGLAGFGMGKSSIFMGAKKTYLDTVAEVNGKKIRTQMVTTPKGWTEFITSRSISLDEDIFKKEKGFINLGGTKIWWDEVKSNEKKDKYRPVVGTTIAATFPQGKVPYHTRDYSEFRAGEIAKIPIAEYRTSDPLRAARFRRNDPTNPIEQDALQHPETGSVKDTYKAQGGEVDLIYDETKPSISTHGFACIPILSEGMAYAKLPVDDVDFKPHALKLNVRSNVQASHPDYPWNQDRTKLRGPLGELATEAVKSIGAKLKAIEMTSTRNVPTVKIGKDQELEFLDTTRQIPKEEMEEISQHKGFSNFATVLSEVFYGIKRTSGRLFDERMHDASFRGLALGGTWLGLNTSASKSKSTESLIDPFQHITETKIRLAAANRHAKETGRRPIDYRMMYARGIVNTLVHEAAHQVNRTEGEGHARAMAHVYDSNIEDMPYHLMRIRDALDANTMQFIIKKTRSLENHKNWERDNRFREGIALLGGGFIPNFSPVSRAIEAESKFGHGAELRYHPDIGNYVKQPSQPDYPAIMRDHPEGLRAAVQNSKSQQGLASGFVPNFGIAESIALGALQGTINNLNGKLGSLAFGFDKNVERLRAINLKYEEVSNQIHVTGLTKDFKHEGVTYNQADVASRHAAFTADYKAKHPEFDIDPLVRETQAEQFKTYSERLEKKHARVTKMSNALMFGAPFAGEITASLTKNLGNLNAGKGIQEFTNGLSSAGQMLSVFPNKLGVALAVGQSTKGFSDALSVYTSKLGTYERRFDVVTTNLEKLASAGNTALESFDRLHSAAGDASISIQDYNALQLRYANSLTELGSVPNGRGQQIVSDMAGAGTPERRREIINRGIDQATREKSEAGVGLQMAQFRSQDSIFGMNINDMMGSEAGIFSAMNEVDRIPKQIALRSAAVSMEQEVLSQEDLDPKLRSRISTQSLTQEDVEGLMKRASKSNLLKGQSANTQGTMMDQFRFEIEKFKMPTGVKPNEWAKHLTSLNSLYIQEEALRMRYNQELANTLSKGTTISNYMLKRQSGDIESRRKKSRFDIFSEDQKNELMSLTRADSGMISARAKTKEKDIRAQMGFEQEDIKNNAALGIGAVIGKLREEFVHRGIAATLQKKDVYAPNEGQLRQAKFLDARQKEFASKPNQYFEALAKSPEDFAKMFLGEFKSEGKSPLNEKDYQTLFNKITGEFSKPEAKESVQKTQEDLKKITEKGLYDLLQVNKEALNAIKANNFKELTAALGGQDALKRGAARQLRRRVRRDEYILSHSRRTIARGEAARDLLEMTPSHMRDNDNPYYRNLYQATRKGYDAANAYVLRGTNFGKSFNRSELSFAQTYGNLKGEHTPTVGFEDRSYSGNRGLNIDTQGLVKSLGEANNSLDSFGKTLETAGEASIKKFSDALSSLADKLQAEKDKALGWRQGSKGEETYLGKGSPYLAAAASVAPVAIGTALGGLGVGMGMGAMFKGGSSAAPTAGAAGTGLLSRLMKSGGKYAIPVALAAMAAAAVSVSRSGKSSSASEKVPSITPTTPPAPVIPTSAPTPKASSTPESSVKPKAPSVSMFPKAGSSRPSESDDEIPSGMVAGTMAGVGMAGASKNRKFHALAKAIQRGDKNVIIGNMTDLDKLKGVRVDIIKKALIEKGVDKEFLRSEASMSRNLIKATSPVPAPTIPASTIPAPAIPSQSVGKNASRLMQERLDRVAKTTSISKDFSEKVKSGGLTLGKKISIDTPSAETGLGKLAKAIQKGRNVILPSNITGKIPGVAEGIRALQGRDTAYIRDFLNKLEADAKLIPNSTETSMASSDIKGVTSGIKHGEKGPSLSKRALKRLKNIIPIKKVESVRESLKKAFSESKRIFGEEIGQPITSKGESIFKKLRYRASRVSRFGSIILNDIRTGASMAGGYGSEVGQEYLNTARGISSTSTQVRRVGGRYLPLAAEELKGNLLSKGRDALAFTKDVISPVTTPVMEDAARVGRAGQKGFSMAKNFGSESASSLRALPQDFRYFLANDKTIANIKSRAQSASQSAKKAGSLVASEARWLSGEGKRFANWGAGKTTQVRRVAGWYLPLAAKELKGNLLSKGRDALAFAKDVTSPVVTPVIEDAARVGRAGQRGFLMAKNYGSEVGQEYLNTARKIGTMGRSGLSKVGKVLAPFATSGKEIAAITRSRVWKAATTTGAYLKDAGSRSVSGAVKGAKYLGDVGARSASGLVSGVGKGAEYLGEMGVRSVSGLGRAGSSLMSEVTGLAGQASQAISRNFGAPGIQMAKDALSDGRIGYKNYSRTMLVRNANAIGRNINKAGKIGSLMSKTPLLGRMISRAGILAPIIGAAFGAYNAKDAGYGVGTGATLGALTGGVDKGSIFGHFGLVKRGGAADTALGFGGAAFTGAMTGAGIGTMVAGPAGTMVGAGIGALAGVAGEGYKHFTSYINEKEKAESDARTSETDLELKKRASDFTNKKFEGGSGETNKQHFESILKKGKSVTADDLQFKSRYEKFVKPGDVASGKVIKKAADEFYEKKKEEIGQNLLSPVGTWEEKGNIFGWDSSKRKTLVASSGKTEEEKKEAIANYTKRATEGRTKKIEFQKRSSQGRAYLESIENRASSMAAKQAELQYGEAGLSDKVREKIIKPKNAPQPTGQGGGGGEGGGGGDEARGGSGGASADVLAQLTAAFEKFASSPQNIQIQDGKLTVSIDLTQLQSQIDAKVSASVANAVAGKATPPSKVAS